ncbi:MAG: SDR family oxidoreductase [Ignavibacteriae bacterium]|nr:MAG: SDR family oxidoreductase [Ignavibacteriota bacterium]
MELGLVGRRALVGGASKGIGRAVAEELARNGAEVVVMARTSDLLDEVVSGLDVSHGQTHGPIVADLEQLDTVIHRVDNAVNERGDFHIVVNNTGGPAGGPLVDSAVESLIQAFHNHVLVSHRLMQLLVPGMRRSGFGRFINIISTSVKQPIEGLGVSNTIRGAMASWSKTLATELGPDGITVNNVLPGATETERLTSIITRQSGARSLGEDVVREEMLREIPARRFAQAGEIANAVAFLASDAAAYISGTSIVVDGGRTRALS